MFTGTVLAARRDHTEKSHPEALGQQVVNDGVCGRAQVKENTWGNKGGGKRETFVCEPIPEEENLFIAPSLGARMETAAVEALLPSWHRHRDVSPRIAQLSLQ